MGTGRLRQRAADALLAVRQDAEVAHRATQLPEPGHQGEAVGVVDRALGQRPARLAHLVAGRKDRNANRIADRDGPAPDGCGEAYVLGHQPPAAPQDDAAAAHVLAGAATIGAPLNARRDQDRVALLAAVLLHHHGIRPFGHRRAGEDADRLAAAGGAAQRMAGRDPARHRQARLARRVEVVEEHGIAVDRRIVIGGDVDRRGHVLRQNAPAGFGQRRRGRTLYRRQAFGQKVQRLVERHQRAAMGETVVAKLRHLDFRVPVRNDRQ